MRLVYVLAFIFLCPAHTLGQAGSNTSGAAPEDERELRILVKRWNEAALKRDADTVANLLADEFSFVGGYSRAQHLEAIKDKDGEHLEYESNDITDLQIRIYGDAAVVTALHSFKMKGEKGERPVPGEEYIMSVWIKRNGRWRGVSACTKSTGIVPAYGKLPRRP